MPIPSARALLVLLALCALSPLRAQDPPTSQRREPTEQPARQKAEEKGPSAIEERLAYLENMHRIGGSFRHPNTRPIPSASQYRAPASNSTRTNLLVITFAFPALALAAFGMIRVGRLEKQVKELEGRLAGGDTDETHRRCSN